MLFQRCCNGVKRMVIYARDPGQSLSVFTKRNLWTTASGFQTYSKSRISQASRQSSSMAPYIVSTEWLHQRMTANDMSGIVVVDVSWEPDGNKCQEDYNSCHIPSASYLNILCGDNNDMYIRNIPPKDKFQAAAQEAGINTNSHVIVYSSSNFCGFFLSARGWWTFKYFGHDNVSVLDGGLQRWQKQGYATTDQAENVKRGNFKVRDTRRLYKSYEQMVDNLKTKEFQVCDARSQAMFSGEESAGHIPGAHNLPIGKMVDSDKGVLQSVDKLKQLFKDSGLDIEKPLASYCIGGMASCSTTLAALMCGAVNVYVYHGSFTEWSKRSDPEQIETSK